MIEGMFGPQVHITNTPSQQPEVKRPSWCLQCGNPVEGTEQAEVINGIILHKECWTTLSRHEQKQFIREVNEQ
jgi:hypothetical protein